MYNSAYIFIFLENSKCFIKVFKINFIIFYFFTGNFFDSINQISA